jgi:hypothetical protein
MGFVYFKTKYDEFIFWIWRAFSMMRKPFFGRWGSSQGLIGVSQAKVWRNDIPDNSCKQHTRIRFEMMRVKLRAIRRNYHETDLSPNVFYLIITWEIPLQCLGILQQSRCGVFSSVHFWILRNTVVVSKLA